jgi:hypothetical protein
VFALSTESFHVERGTLFSVSELETRVLGYFTILVAAVCGLAGAPAWTVIVAAIALSSISYARHTPLFRRASALGMQDAIDQTLVASLFNGLLAAAVAIGFGSLLRVLA